MKRSEWEAEARKMMQDVSDTVLTKPQNRGTGSMELDWERLRDLCKAKIEPDDRDHYSDGDGETPGQDLADLNAWASDETRKHIARVARVLHQVAMRLLHRADHHDASKLESPEASMFAVYTDKLKGLTYGSPEYKQCLAEMKPALDHHYAANRHHPEHHVLGIPGMNLIDLIEMIADWIAACERHADGDIWSSLEKNRARFGIGEQLAAILGNTVSELEG